MFLSVSSLVDIKTEFVTGEILRDTEVVTFHQSNNVASLLWGFFLKTHQENR